MRIFFSAAAISHKLRTCVEPADFRWRHDSVGVLFLEAQSRTQKEQTRKQNKQQTSTHTQLKDHPKRQPNKQTNKQTQKRVHTYGYGPQWFGYEPQWLSYEPQQYARLCMSHKGSSTYEPQRV